MAVALLVALILLSGVLLAPGLAIGPSLDASVFSHVAGRMLDGAPLYAGAWDHKPPGIYLGSAAAQALLGWLGPWIADWLLSVAATAGIGLAVAVTLTRVGIGGWPRTLAALGAVALAGQYLLALGGGLTEPLATVLVAVTLVEVMRPAGSWRAAAIGVLCGGALLISAQLLPGVLVVVALGIAGAPAGGRLARGALLTAGIAAPIAAVVAWLAASGSLPAAIDAIVGYAGAYRATSGDYGASLGAPVAAWTALVSLFLVAPALLGAGFLARAATPTRRLGMASLLWIAGSTLFVLVQGRFYAHYVIPLAVPLGILAGYGLARVGESLQHASSAGRRAIILAPSAVALALSVVAAALATGMQIAPLAQRSAQMAEVSTWIRDQPSASSSLLVWGNEPHLYDLAGRRPALRFSYFYPLSTPGYSTSAMIAAAASDLAADPPSVVVDASADAPGDPGYLPLLIPHPVAREGRELDLLDPLRDFVAAHYRLAATVAGWPIYVLRSSASQ